MQRVVLVGSRLESCSYVWLLLGCEDASPLTCRLDPLWALVTGRNDFSALSQPCHPGPALHHIEFHNCHELPLRVMTLKDYVLRIDYMPLESEH